MYMGSSNLEFSVRDGSAIKYYIHTIQALRRLSTATGFPAFSFSNDTLYCTWCLVRNPSSRPSPPDDLVWSNRMDIYPPQRRPQSGAAARPPCCHGSSSIVAIGRLRGYDRGISADLQLRQFFLVVLRSHGARCLSGPPQESKGCSLWHVHQTTRGIVA
jgi:hypothetical protein